MRQLIVLILIAFAAGGSHAGVASAPRSPKIDVVFALDTTGSMQPMLDTAKRKIWSIARSIGCARPTPSIRMGIVAYRDRGDAYVVKKVPLTTDLDRFYAELMQLQAGGGGDTPESVNEALDAAVSAFDHSEGALMRLIYLVGDAPPHENYSDDTPWTRSCSRATKRGIVVHSVQCGAREDTRRVWQRIAAETGGEYLPVPSAARPIVTTPFDEQLARHGTMLDGTVVPYGDPSSAESGKAKLDRSREINKAASPEALADRAAFNASAAGLENLTGARELIRDYSEGKLDLSQVVREQLPEPLRSMDDAELTQYLQDQADYRAGLRDEIAWYAEKRQQFIDERTESVESGFDEKVLESLVRQGQSLGLDYGTAHCR